MPDYRRRNCADPPRGCAKHEREVGPISWRGLCEECGSRNMNAMHDDLTARSGPGFVHWRTRIAASVGAVLLDDSTRRP